MTLSRQGLRWTFRVLGRYRMRSAFGADLQHHRQADDLRAGLGVAEGRSRHGRRVGSRPASLKDGSPDNVGGRDRPGAGRRPGHRRSARGGAGVGGVRPAAARIKCHATNAFFRRPAVRPPARSRCRGVIRSRPAGCRRAILRKGSRCNHRDSHLRLGQFTGAENGKIVVPMPCRH